MKVINLFGGPGARKSTFAYGVSYYMKMANHDIEFVPEYAKDLVYDGTLEFMLDRQEVIFAEQNQRLHRNRGVDFVVTDSPILLSYVYARMNEEQKAVPPWPALEAFQSFVLAQFRTYDNVNIFINRPDTYVEKGRAHTLEQAQAIDAAIKKVLVVQGFDRTELQAGDHTVAAILKLIGVTE